MYTISKDFHFSASHQLLRMPEGHPCARLHGHNYVVRLELASAELDEYGFVVDYTALKPFKQYIDEYRDHLHLNEVLDSDGHTAELLARHLYEWASQRWSQVSAVAVSETPKTWARYQP